MKAFEIDGIFDPVSRTNFCQIDQHHGTVLARFSAHAIGEVQVAVNPPDGRSLMPLFDDLVQMLRGGLECLPPPSHGGEVAASGRLSRSLQQRFPVFVLEITIHGMHRGRRLKSSRGEGDSCEMIIVPMGAERPERKVFDDDPTQVVVLKCVA